MKEKIAELRALLREGRVPLRVKIICALVIAYLLCPIDLIPDFIPVIGQLDDILIVGFAVAYATKVMRDQAARQAE